MIWDAKSIGSGARSRALSTLQFVLMLGFLSAVKVLKYFFSSKTSINLEGEIADPSSPRAAMPFPVSSASASRPGAAHTVSVHIPSSAGVAPTKTNEA